MKLRTSLFLLGLCILLAGVFFACASAPAVPIGNATGTATEAAPGFHGDVIVTITIANGIITDVVIKGDGESPTIGGPAMLKATNAIKKYNSADIDIISGATITTMAVKQAAQAAINKIVAGQ